MPWRAGEAGLAFEQAAVLMAKSRVLVESFPPAGAVSLVRFWKI